MMNLVAVGASAGLALALTACGGSGSDNGSGVDSGTSDPARAAVLQQLRDDAAASGGNPAEIDCVMAELEGLPYEQLNEMLSATPSDDVIAIAGAAMQKCGGVAK